MAASMRLANLEQQPNARPPAKSPFRVRLLYAWIALLHFLRPHHDRCLADISSGLLTSQ